MEEDRTLTTTRPSVAGLDDHAALSRSVRLRLATAGFELVGEASDGVEAVRMAATMRPQPVGGLVAKAQLEDAALIGLLG